MANPQHVEILRQGAEAWNQWKVANLLLSEADLSGANLSDADLSRANLSEADLSEADLGRANLVGVSVAAKKGTILAAKWSPSRGAVRSQPFPLLRAVVQNGPEPSRARRCWARRSEPLTARTVLR